MFYRFRLLSGLVFVFLIVFLKSLDFVRNCSVHLSCSIIHHRIKTTPPSLKGFFVLILT
jgi:uncharacterized membrane protein